MIAVIDYKAGNLTSVVKALRYLGARTSSSRSRRRCAAARRSCSPASALQPTQLLKASAHRAVATRSQGTPFLGICVGLQWLYRRLNRSAGDSTASATSPASASASPPPIEGADLKSPHVGWNSLEEIRPDSRLLARHSRRRLRLLHALLARAVSQDTAAVTNYGGAFTAAVERGNVMGVQFHPEKSADTGLQVLKNFLEF